MTERTPRTSVQCPLVGNLYRCDPKCVPARCVVAANMDRVTEPEVLWWQRMGYLAGKEIGDGLWVCLAPMIYTWRLMVCTEVEVMEFWCYPSKDLARAIDAFTAFDGHGDPLAGWVRHHPSERRRAPL